MRSLTILASIFCLAAGFVIMQNHEPRVSGDTRKPQIGNGISQAVNLDKKTNRPETKEIIPTGSESPLEKCEEDPVIKLGKLSAKPDPMFENLLASNTSTDLPLPNLEEVSKCALQFSMKENTPLFVLKAGNLEVEARKIHVTGSNALLTVEARQGDLLVTNKNIQAQCSKFEIKLPYCGPQNGKLYVTARDKVAYFSCDGLHGDFERMTLNSGKVTAELTVDSKSNLMVKLGDAQLKCKSIALELADGQILLDNEIDWEGSGIDLNNLGK